MKTSIRNNKFFGHVFSEFVLDNKKKYIIRFKFSYPLS